MFINKIEFNMKYFPCFSKWGGGAINCGAIQTSNLTSLTFIWRKASELKMWFWDHSLLQRTNSFIALKWSLLLTLMRKQKLFLNINCFKIIFTIYFCRWRSCHGSSWSFALRSGQFHLLRLMQCDQI